MHYSDDPLCVHRNQEVLSRKSNYDAKKELAAEDAQTKFVAKELKETEDKLNPLKLEISNQSGIAAALKIELNEAKKAALEKSKSVAGAPASVEAAPAQPQPQAAAKPEDNIATRVAAAKELPEAETTPGFLQQSLNGLSVKGVGGGGGGDSRRCAISLMKTGSRERTHGGRNDVNTGEMM